MMARATPGPSPILVRNHSSGALLYVPMNLFTGVRPKGEQDMQPEHLGARAARSEDGFTLLELMMVILIIGILIAVMSPVFLGASARAKDRAMETSLTTATTGAKSLFLAKADYSLATPAALTAETGGLTYVPGATGPTGANVVSVFSPPGGTQVVLAGR